MRIPDGVKRALILVNQVATEQGVTLMLVGGVIRDTLLDFESLDYDLVIEGNAIQFAESVHQVLPGKLEEFKSFITAKILGLSGYEPLEDIDIASARREQYPHPGALPIVELAPFSEDLKRRDFTINAMAMPLGDYIECDGRALDLFRSKIIDPLGGLRDLADRQIRILHPLSFMDDPTRLFRACRYVVRVQGSLEPETARLFKAALEQNALLAISDIRVLNELKRCVHEPDPGASFWALRDYGLLGRLELYKIEHEEAVLKALACKSRGPDPVEDMLAIFYRYSDEALRENRFRKFGLGKKFFKRMAI